MESPVHGTSAPDRIFRASTYALFTSTYASSRTFYSGRIQAVPNFYYRRFRASTALPDSDCYPTSFHLQENEILSSAGDCWVWFITQYYDCSHRRAVQQRWSIYPYSKIESG